jgi:hypothetical protein
MIIGRTAIYDEGKKEKEEKKKDNKVSHLPATN